MKDCIGEHRIGSVVFGAKRKETLVSFLTKADIISYYIDFCKNRTILAQFEMSLEHQDIF